MVPYTAHYGREAGCVFGGTRSGQASWQYECAFYDKVLGQTYPQTVTCDPCGDGGRTLGWGRRSGCSPVQRLNTLSDYKWCFVLGPRSFTRTGRYASGARLCGIEAWVPRGSPLPVQVRDNCE